MSKVDQEIVVAQEPTAPQLVIEQAVERAVETDVSSFGMEKEIQPKNDDVELEETSIGNSESVLETHSSLTQYVDVSASKIGVSSETAIDIVDSNFVFPPDYFKVVERSFKIHEYQLDNTAPNQYPYRLDLLNGLLQKSSIMNKLLYAQYLRFNLEVQIKIMATNFHYGQLMAVWRPSYSPYMACNYEITDRVIKVRHFSSSQTEANKVLFTPCYTPYDNVHTASQIEHHIIPVTGGANLTLKLPWTLNRQYVPTVDMMLPENHIGFFDIYQLTPIGPADIDKCTVQIYARMRDIVGFGYRAPANPCSGNFERILTREYYKANEGNSRSLVHVVYPSSFQWQATHSTQLSGFGWNLRELPLSDASWEPNPWWGIVNAREKAQKALEEAERKKEQSTKEEDVSTTEIAESGELVRQERGGSLYGTFNAAVSTANTIASWVGDALAFLGLSRPPMKGVPQRFIHVAPPVSNAVGPDYCLSNGVNPESLVINKRSDHSEMVAIQKLGECETYLGWYDFTPTKTFCRGWLYPGRVIWQGNFDDRKFKIAYRTPTSMLLEKFALWRGNAKYRLHFSCSSFVVARMSIIVRYEGATDTEDSLGMVPTQIVEIKGDTTIEGEIPFLCEAPWKPWNEAVARLEVNLTSTPVSWNSAKAPPIYMSAWVSYPGFQVAMPTDRINVAVPWGIGSYEAQPPDERAYLDKPEFLEEKLMLPSKTVQSEMFKIERMVRYRKESAEVAESGRLPGVTGSHQPKQYGMNDIFTSLYHLAKRFNPVYGRVICPLKPNVIVMTQKSAMPFGESYLITTLQPSNSHFAQCFRWIRGSYDLISTGSYQMVDLLYPDGVYESDKMHAPKFMVNQGPNDYGKPLYMYSVTANHMSKNGQSLIAARSPYHSNFPFISAPALTIQTTNKPGYFWFGAVCDEHDEKVNFTVADGLAQKNTRMPYMEMAYGDDLCYNQWMGCPLGVSMQGAENGYFPGYPRSLLESVAQQSA